MEQNLHTFALEAEADERIWQQMNVYLHLYLYDPKGVQTGMLSAEHKEGDAPGVLRVESAVQVAQVRICLYVVPRRLPDSSQVSDSPPMNLTLRVLRDGQPVDTLRRKINSWGGDQLIGLAYQ